MMQLSGSTEDYTVFAVLTRLQARMMEYHRTYRKGELTEEEYLSLIRPIDRLIDRIELSMLGENRGDITPPDTPVLKGSFDDVI